MHKPLTKSSLTSRDEQVVYTSAADIADFAANGSPNSRTSSGGSSPWNTYPHFAKNNNDGDMDIVENVGITVEGETEVISVAVTGDGATHQFGILNYETIPNSPGFRYENAISGTITFKYFFPTGHSAIGKYWHVGTSEKDYTANPHQIVGNAWTEAVVKFGKKHGAGRNKIQRDGTNYRFLCIKDSGGAQLEGESTVFTGTGTFHIKDVVIVGEVPANETKSETVGSEGY